jgi:hypothetical protein
MHQTNDRIDGCRNEERKAGSMNTFFIRILVILFLMTGCVSTVQAGERNVPPKPQGRIKPPPEAITACKGKSEGTVVQFTSPRGDMLTGVCRQFEDILVAMPERGTPPPEGKKPD